MQCWKCGIKLDSGGETPPSKKLPFRAMCEHCYAWLHCCKNCRHFRPGLPNDCSVPGTEWIPDREAFNFCEEYSLLGAAPKAAQDPGEISQRLFGEKPKKQQSFDDLFHD